MITPSELSAIQGILVHGYTRLPHCNYLFLRVINRDIFLHWLKQQHFQDASIKPSANCQNIAFTSEGLAQLGINVSEHNGFSIDFIQGMDTPHKNRTLGDFGHNATEKWKWGSRQQPVHVLLMQFCTSENESLNQLDLFRSSVSQNGMELVSHVYSASLPQGKEHFGFQDGLSQPDIKGIKDRGVTENTLNPGEFILGYPNSYNVLPLNPVIDSFDFGKNGSYMVVRQLEQHVRQFWDTIMQLENQDLDQAILLASKMVGRWPNGKPLVLAESQDTPVEDKGIFDFMYYEEDKHGYKCPVGSHIRRTNPRDSFDDNPQDSLETSNKHRILRRGRPYGPPICPEMNIANILKAESDREERGLVFICFNTDISRQFEFVQHTWSNNQKFDGLYNDVDPIMGVQGSYNDNTMDTTQFEVQACPFRKRYKNIPSFVTVRGGDYFFLPGIQAIEFLCSSLVTER